MIVDSSNLNLNTQFHHGEQQQEVNKKVEYFNLCEGEDFTVI